MNSTTPLTQKLINVEKKELKAIIEYYLFCDSFEKEMLFKVAREQMSIYYGNKVYFRGLIEFSSYCKNNCYYCGIRHNNSKAKRYRLSKDEILSCCSQGYDLGFRTFVLQSGDDPFYTDDTICDIITEIKTTYPDSAITLSIGEKQSNTFKRFFHAGADRYLLRHETANEEHYGKLHPNNMSLEYRKKCLNSLKEIGFQVGAGFMVGSPHQTIENLAEDLIFLRELQPHMIGIGPFIPHKDTIWGNQKVPTPDLTLIMISLVRLMLPKTLLPSTTALGTIDPHGRENGLNAGANVVMPNLSPKKNRKDYSLYDNKICTGEEAAESVQKLAASIKSAGFEPDFSRGDHWDFN